MAGGVIDGQGVDAAVTNAAFLAKNADDSTTNNIGLASANPAYGSSITSIQQELNAQASQLGVSVGGAYNAVITWASSIVGAATSSAVAKINALVALFSGSTGHKHTGVDGDGAWVKSAGLLSYASSAAFVSAKGSAAAAGDSYYDTTLAESQVYNGSTWAAMGGGGGALVVTGSTGTPQAITGAGGIAFTGTDARQLWFVEGSGGAVTVTANPQIAPATTTGQELIVMGTSDTNTLTLSDGTGLSLNGPVTLMNHQSLYLVWDGSVWVEIPRR